MLTVAVQAGGRSSRMGEDKALLQLDGIPLIERLLQRVSGLGDEILITTNRPQDYQYLGLRMASDPEPGAGALHGLHTALKAARGQTVLVLACDMPFVSRPLLEHMLQLAEAADLAGRGVRAAARGVQQGLPAGAGSRAATGPTPYDQLLSFAQLAHGGAGGNRPAGP